MAVKEGYKQTEVGVIPEDWEVTTIGQLGTFSKGQGIRKNEALSGNIPCVRYGEIYTLHHNYIKGFGSFISEEVAQTSKMLKQGDILFAGSGETKEEIGKSVAFIDNYEAYVGGDVIVFSPKHGNSLFYGYLFNSKEVAKQKYSKGQGDAVVHISASSLSNIQIPLPPLPEQKAIATALSDMDRLINSLSKLIDKKKNIKQGAMQELLAGKKRLEGFSGEWVRKKVEEIAIVSRGRVISHVEISKALTKKYPVYSSQTTNNGIMGYLDTYDFNGDYITWTTDGVNAGTVFYRWGMFNCTNVCGTIKLNKGNYYFVAKRLGIEAVKYVSRNLANPKLMNDVMKKVTITIPPTIEEQSAIATILSDMDSEIEKLQARLDKYKAIKQGMMQELLTGRIRLMEET